MQNQYPNGNNLTNDPAQTGTKQQSGTKYYIFGMVTGILAAIAVTLGTVGAVRLYRAVTPLSRGNVSSGVRTDKVESITDENVGQKLAVLEDTIGKYFWKDVEEETLEDGLYRGLLDALEDPYSVYYTSEELIALQQQTEGIYYGIGAYIQDGDAGYVQISRVIKNTPAEASGLMQGDYIYKVNDEDMQERINRMLSARSRAKNIRT